MKPTSRNAALWALLSKLLILALWLASVPSAVLAQETEPRPPRIWATGPVLNQGSTPFCVGYAARGFLDAEPKPFTSEYPSATRIYWKAHNVFDDIPDDPNNPYEGTTVQGAAAYLEAIGLLDYTEWSTDTLLLGEYLLRQGPVLIASPWTYSMDYWQQPGGYVEPKEGDLVRAYHAWLIYGYDEGDPLDRSDDLIYAQNSWGERWGDGGRFTIKRANLQVLLDSWQWSAGAMPHKADYAPGTLTVFVRVFGLLAY